jgi:tyrosinase
MKLSHVLPVGLIGGASAIKFMEVDALAAQGVFKLGLHVAQSGYPSPQTCTLENVAIRREWYAQSLHAKFPLPLTFHRSTLSKSEKINYIEAVQCLAKLPAKTPSSVAAGARSRYDDLVVTHIQQSTTIHGTGNFLSWHRYFTWTFEQMLRNECGYKGYQPYYNWAW